MERGGVGRGWSACTGCNPHSPTHSLTHSLTPPPHTQSGEADSFQPYDEVDDSNYINSVSREELNNLLLNKAEAAGVDVRFGLRMSCYDKDGVVHFERDEEDGEGDGEGEGEGEGKAAAKEKGSARLRGLATYNDYTPGSIRVKPRLLLGCDGAYSCAYTTYTILYYAILY